MFTIRPTMKSATYIARRLRRSTSSITNDTIPGPKPLPVIGNLNLFRPFGPSALDQVNDVAGLLSKTFGPIVRLRLGVDIVFLFDPKDVATVFQNEDKYPQRPVFEALVKHRRQHADRYLHMGLFTDNGPGWAHLRTRVNPLLRPGAEDAYLEGHLEVAEDFMAHLTNVRDSEGRVANMLEELYKYTQEAVGLVCFGSRLGCFGCQAHTGETGANINANVADMLQSMAVTLLALPVWKLFPTPAYSRLVRSQEYLWTIVAEMLKTARRRLLLDPLTEKRKSPFLTALLLLSEMDKRDVILVVLELFQAGIDSTASAIVMTLYHLARDPAVQQQLVDELERLLPRTDQPLTPETLLEFRFLRACIKETLRLSCPVGGTARILPKTISLSGHDVAAGTLIIANHPAMSVNPTHVSDPENYAPERWLTRPDHSKRTAGLSTLYKIQPFVTLPFSFGARSCPGRRVAQQEIAVFLIKFFQKFRCTYDGAEPKMVMRLNYVPDRPLHFKLDDKIN